MPPSLVVSRGTLRVAQRPANIHPESWDPKLDQYSPLAKYPLTTTLDAMPEGEPVPSSVHHWFTRPFFALNGAADDVYTSTSLASAYSSGPAAVNAEVCVKPSAADVEKLAAVEKYQQVLIHSTSVASAVRALITGVERSGSLACFTIRLLEADTNRVLEGTGLTWSLTQRSQGEETELGEGTNQHESDRYNYLYTDFEPFAISRRELRELSRRKEGMKDKKKERELDALDLLNQRREFTVLEGVRATYGDRYYAGGVRFFLQEHESSNIVNWRTDTTFSLGSDSVLGGTLPFLRRVLDAKTRPWSRVGAKKQLHMSAHLRSVIDECVLASGDYAIEYGTNKYGINVGWLRGLDNEVELVENALFNHYPAYANTIYVIDPENIKRHTPADEGTSVSRAKGLEYIPWSAFKKMDGENFITRIKGGWGVEETFSFKQLASHAIIDNVGLTKA